jgi:hypothetical protein
MIAGEIAIRLDDGAFVVSGWKPSIHPPADGWSSVFRVYAGEGELPPMLGTYSYEADSLTFRPRFPLEPGLRVRAVFDPPGGRQVESHFDVPRRSAQPSTRVAGVYPSAGVLPENQLKLYVEFSAPMQRGEAWDRIHLLDARGTQVELPFLEIDQELWDPEGRRFTVLFDPGRIKRGVLPLEETGPAMEAGGRYTLVVDAAWKDANGLPLVQPYRKKFRVGVPDRTPADPKQWTIHPPAAGSADPLVVRFPEPMDYALLFRLLWVEYAGNAVAGSVNVDQEERRWSFSPHEAWRAGAYQLMVDTALEDLAGNRIGRAFDVDTFEKVTARVSRRTVQLPFEIRAQ